jgi:hypothetical protein
MTWPIWLYLVATPLVAAWIGWHLGRTCWLRVGSWVIAAGVAAVIVEPVIVFVASLAIDPDRRVWVVPVLLEAAYFGSAVVCFLIPGYVLVFAIWARYAPRLTYLETTKSGLIASSALLGLPAILLVAIASLDPSPVAWNWSTAGQTAGRLALWLPASAILAIYLPRLLVPWLRPGAFALAPR